MRFLSLSALFVVVGCQANGISVRNNEPEAAIVWPQDGATLTEGALITLRATVTDTNDHPEELVATWLSGDEVLCDEAPVAADGSVLCETVLGAEDTTLTLVTRDPMGATSTALVTVEVVANAAPEVEVFAPQANGVYLEGERVVIDAWMGDAEDALDALTVTWTDSAGALDLSTVVDSDGTISGSALLAVGAHDLTIAVADAAGGVGSVTVSIEVVATPGE